MMAQSVVGKNWIALGRICMAGFVLLGCGACVGSLPAEPVVMTAPQTGEPELQLWREAMEYFLRGDYDRAMALFGALSESARDPAISRKGLFGLAATRLMVAKNAAEFDEAMVLLGCWNEIAPREMISEDPRLLVAVLERFSGFGLRDTPQPQSPRSNRDFVYSSLQACRATLKLKEKEMDRMKSRLDSKDREIRKLRSQIESLEAIDRKFQEKKREATNP